MAHRFGEDVWYVLNIFNGIGYMVLFVVVMIWLRLLLHVVEDAVTPLRKRPHKFVRPLSEPSDLTTFSRCEQPTELETMLQPKS